MDQLKNSMKRTRENGCIRIQKIKAREKKREEKAHYAGGFIITMSLLTVYKPLNFGARIMSCCLNGWQLIIQYISIL